MEVCQAVGDDAPFTETAEISPSAGGSVLKQVETNRLQRVRLLECSILSKRLHDMGFRPCLFIADL